MFRNADETDLDGLEAVEAAVDGLMTMEEARERQLEGYTRKGRRAHGDQSCAILSPGELLRTMAYSGNAEKKFRIFRDIITDRIIQKHERAECRRACTGIARKIALAVCNEPGKDGKLDKGGLLALHDSLLDNNFTCTGILDHLTGKDREDQVKCPDCGGAGSSVVVIPRSLTDNNPRYDTKRYPCETCKATGWVASEIFHVKGCWALDLLLGYR